MTRLGKPIYAPDRGFFGIDRIVGDAEVDTNEMFMAAMEAGFERTITLSDGVQVNYWLSAKADFLIKAFTERDYQPYGKWTVSFGPDTMWQYSYMFQHDNDAVVARLILEG